MKYKFDIIVEYMKKNKLSKNQFCKRAEISRSTLEKIENSSTKLRVYPIIKVCDLLNIKIEDFINKDK